MSKKEMSQTLPPWLWVWFIFYVYMLPSMIGTFKENFGSFLFSTDPTYAHLTLISKLQLINAPYWFPIILIFLGEMSVFFPQLRKYYIEKKYNLTENYPKIAPIKEIEEFLELHAPDLRIKANLLSPREMVFVYPIGYRKTCIAIFGKLIKSWRSDREATKAMLLHEIGHYRNGDALVLGAGSLFELAVYFIFLYLPIFIFLTLINLSSDRNVALSFMNGMTAMSRFFLLLAVYIFPLIGIWCAELNADRFMVKSKINTIDNSLKVIERLEKNKSFKQQLLYHITHPPNSLRHWMVFHSNDRISVLLFLFLFPLAHLLQLLMFIIYALSLYIVIFLFGITDIQEFSGKLLKWVMVYMNSRSFIWLFLSIVVILWPILAVYWVRLFSGLREACNIGYYESYFFVALVLLCVCVFSYTV